MRGYLFIYFLFSPWTVKYRKYAKKMFNSDPTFQTETYPFGVLGSLLKESHNSTNIQNISKSAKFLLCSCGTKSCGLTLADALLAVGNRFEFTVS